MQIIDCDWVYANGSSLDDAVATAIKRYDESHPDPVNFVWMNGDDAKRLNGFSKLGVRVLLQPTREEEPDGNFLVGRLK